MTSKSAEQGSEYDISLDAELWARAPHWTSEEFDYLAVGLDPQKIREADPEASLDLLDKERLLVRQRVAVILRGRNYRQQLSPAEFVQIANDASILLPEALTYAVKKLAPKKQKDNGPSEKRGKEVTDGSLQYKKLLRMFLVVAVEQCSYDPRKQRQEAVMDIVRDASSMGLDLPLNFHPFGIGALLVGTPVGAGGATDIRAELSDGAARVSVAVVRCSANALGVR